MSSFSQQENTSSGDGATDSTCNNATATVTPNDDLDEASAPNSNQLPRGNSHHDHRQRHRPSLAVLGTGSDVGKSTIAAGLCRLLANHCRMVAPFKGQNMSNNSHPALISYPTTVTASRTQAQAKEHGVRLVWRRPSRQRRAVSSGA
jgi:hypothetical protein